MTPQVTQALCLAYWVQILSEYLLTLAKMGAFLLLWGTPHVTQAIFLAYWVQILCEDVSAHGGSLPQMREQMSGPDLHVFTLKFSALKNWFFSLFRGQKFFF